MSRLKRRVMAFALTVLVAFTNMPVSVMAADSEEPVEAAASDNAVQPAETTSDNEAEPTAKGQESVVDEQEPAADEQQEPVVDDREPVVEEQKQEPAADPAPEADGEKPETDVSEADTQGAADGAAGTEPAETAPQETTPEEQTDPAASTEDEEPVMRRISFRIAEGVEVYLDGEEEKLDDGATFEKEDGAAVVFTVTVPENASASVKAEENEIAPGDDGSYSVNADRDQTVDVSYTADEEAEQDEENVTEPETEEKDSEEAGEAVGTVTVQDVTISVKPFDAESGADALPEGYQVTAEAVDAEAIIASVEEQLEDGLSVLDARAFNITILDADGNEIQPEGGVTVSISGIDMEGSRFAVAHMADGAEAAELIGTDYDSADVTFTAESFSDYAVLALADYRVNIMGMDEEIMPIDITGERTVEVGGTITLTSDVHNGSNHEWSSSDKRKATVTSESSGKGNNRTYSGVVTGVAQGYVTITHTYTTGYGGNQQTHTETYDVTVTETTSSENLSGIIFEYHDGFSDLIPASARNIMKYTIDFIDEDGNRVDMPTDAYIPETIKFDGPIVNIDENTFAAIDIPGFANDEAYCYFYWSGAYSGTKFAVTSVKNTGRISDGYRGYNSYLGFTSTQGIGDDYYNDNTGKYYAYNPTGTLVVVFVKHPANAPDTYYRDAFNKGYVGERVDAHEDRSIWSNRKFTYYPYDLTGTLNKEYMEGHYPHDEYQFVGWSTEKGSDGNGDPSHKVNGNYFNKSVTEDVTLYAIWEKKDPALTSTKTLTNEGKGTDGKFQAGDTATFDITVRNIGNTIQNNVIVTEQLPGAKIVEGAGYTINEAGQAVIAEMAPGAKVTVKAEYTVTEKDISSREVLKNVALVDGEGTDPKPEVEIPREEQKSELTSKKTLTNKGTGKGGAFKAGETANFDIVVENTGNTTQTNVTVSEMEGATIVKGEDYEIKDGKAVIEKMAPGAKVIVKATYTVTQEDIDSEEPLKNIAAVEGDGDTPDPEIPIPKDEQKPDLSATKSLTNSGSGMNGAFKANETATFDITVTNSGNTTQKNVTVSEMEGAKIVEGDGYTIEDGKAVIAEMVPGAVVIVKATYKVTQADIDSDADLENIATVNDDKPTKPEPIPKDEQKSGLSATKGLTNSGSGTNGAFKAGETATFEITVTNSGNTTQKNVIVSEQLTGATIVAGTGYTINEAGQAVIKEMAPGTMVFVNATYTVTQADIDSDAELKNIALVNGDNGTNPDPKPEVEIPEEEKKPGLTSKKSLTNAGTGADGAFKAGETAEFDITVTNSGNTTQKNVIVSEQLAGAKIVAGDGYTINDAGQAVIAEMAPGATVTVKATYEVTQEDIDSDAELKNVALVDGDNGKEPDPTPEIPIPEETKNPKLTATKALTNGTNKDGSEKKFKAGETAEFDITVTNSGNTTQTNVIVSEMEGAKIVAGEGYTIENGNAVIAKMGPGAVVIVKASYEVTQKDIDSDAELKNIATVKGDGDTPNPEIPIPEEEKKPGLTAEKILTNGMNEDGSERKFKAGETAEFDIKVTNSGNTTQKNVIVSEQLAGATIVNGKGYTINDAGQAVIEKMAPGAMVTVKATYEVTQADIDSDAELKNVALVKDNDETTPDPTPEIPIPEEKKNPGLTTSKTVTNAPEGGFKAGQTAEFDITVTNSGNTTQTNVTVTEQLAGATIVDGEGYTINDAGQAVIAEMAPGATVVVKATYTVTQADIDSDAELKNVALVEGDNGTEPDPQPEVEIPEEPQVPGVNIIKKVDNGGTAKGSAFRLGETIYYQIIVENTGNTTWNGLEVKDDKFGTEVNVYGDGVTYYYNENEKEIVLSGLAPKKRAVITYPYVVTVDDIERGSVENTATAENASFTKTVDTDDRHPALEAEKKLTNSGSGTDGQFVLGDTAEFDIIVKNTGNVKQTVTVTEELTGAKIVKGSGYTINAAGKAVITDMAPGATVTVKAEYTITQEDIDSENGLWNHAAVRNQGNDGPDPSVEIPVEKAPAWTVDKTVESRGSNGGSFRLGEIIQYQIVVKNTGNTTLNDLPVVDEMLKTAEDINVYYGKGVAYTYTRASGQVEIDGLAPDNSVVITYSHKVTEDDIKAGSVTNKVVVGNEEKEITTDVEPERKALSAVKALTNAGTGANGAFKAGEKATFDITVTNTGNTTQTNVTVTEQLSGATIVAGEGYTVNGNGQAEIAEMAPGAAVTVKAEYTVTQEDINSKEGLENIALVKGDNGNDPDPTPGTDIPKEEQNPKLSVDKKVKGGTNTFDLDEAATFSITVTNTGNVTLTDVVIEDELTGNTGENSIKIGTLAPGESSTEEVSYTVTEEDIKNGRVINTATAKGTAPDGSPVEGSDSVRLAPEDPRPHVTVEKTVTSAPENGTAYKLGETVTYRITVTNDGNVTAENFTVVDDLTEDSWTVEALAPKASETFTSEYTVTEEDIKNGSVRNVATVDGVDGTPDTADVPTQSPEPSLSVIKKADKTANLKAGDVVTYTITVTNNGNVTITDVTLDDELAGVKNAAIGTLKPGESADRTVTYKVTVDDIVKGKVTNVATATGKTPNDGTVKASGQVDVWTVPANAKLEVEKLIQGGKNFGFKRGETISYSIWVRNVGNVPLHDVTVTDELTGDYNISVGNLAPGESTERTVSYTVTEEDILAGEILNTAEAAAKDPYENPVNGTDKIKAYPEAPAGALKVDKEVIGARYGYKSGDTVQYTVWVENTGNVSRDNIVITDDLTGNIGDAALKVEGSLAPGEKAQVMTADYTVTDKDVAAGEIQNIASAEATDPNGLKLLGQDDVIVETVKMLAVLDVEKKTTSTPADGVAYALGEIITYEITAANNGNVALKDVVVEDSLTNDTWTLDTLAAGGSETWSASHIVTEADLLEGVVLNTANAAAIAPDGSEVKNNASVQDPVVEAKGHLTIVKEATSIPEEDGKYKLGEMVTYEITVTNDGNLTVTGITVTDELTTDTWTIDSLAPGASETFTTQHQVTAADIAAGKVVNVATATGISPDPDEPDVPVDPGRKEVPTEGSVTVYYEAVGNGSVDPDQNTFNELSGQPAGSLAVPDAGYRFVEWRNADGEVVSTQAQFVPEDWEDSEIFYAYFEAIPPTPGPGPDPTTPDPGTPDPGTPDPGTPAPGGTPVPIVPVAAMPDAGVLGVIRLPEEEDEEGVEAGVLGERRGVLGVHTGDEAPVAGMLGLMGIAALAVEELLRRRKKNAR